MSLLMITLILSCSSGKKSNCLSNFIIEIFILISHEFLDLSYGFTFPTVEPLVENEATSPSTWPMPDESHLVDPKLGSNLSDPNPDNKTSLIARTKIDITGSTGSVSGNVESFLLNIIFHLKYSCNPV